MLSCVHLFVPAHMALKYLTLTICSTASLHGQEGCVVTLRGMIVPHQEEIVTTILELRHLRKHFTRSGF